MANLSLGLGDTAILAQSRDMLFELLNAAHRRKDVSEVARLADSINKNISLSARDLGDSTSRKKMQMAINRISTPLDGSVGAVPMLSRDDLGEGSEIGDRGKTDQLDSVLNGEYDPVPDDNSGEDEVNVIHS